MANLTSQERQALRIYRQAAGRTWKFQLSNDWLRSRSDLVGDQTYSVLHGLRNRLGPTWLINFRFPSEQSQ